MSTTTLVLDGAVTEEEIIARIRAQAPGLIAGRPAPERATAVLLEAPVPPPTPSAPARAAARPASQRRVPESEPLLTPAEVATMFRVDPKTVTRWAKAGKLTSIRTLGGHRRYRETEVRALLAGITD